MTFANGLQGFATIFGQSVEVLLYGGGFALHGCIIIQFASDTQRKSCSIGSLGEFGHGRFRLNWRGSSKSQCTVQ